jgi:Na+-driven multidrug efflux pump
MQFSKIKSKLIGDRHFYARVVTIVVPIIVQQLVTNVVNLLDNVMVGRVGTLEMSAVAIVNQLIFIFNL